jgi:ABC-type transporter Mla maintaining outer membrane lipid asymmetry ATPase subunit MlaF
VGERVALLDGGKILVDLPPREFETSEDPRVVAFVRGDGSEDAESAGREEGTE